MAMTRNTESTAPATTTYLHSSPATRNTTAAVATMTMAVPRSAIITAPVTRPTITAAGISV